MDHAEDDNFDGDIFIYRGGRAPQHITHALIDKSVDEIEDEAFRDCHDLVQVDTHDGIRRIGKEAFRYCSSLRRINLKSVVEIGVLAFHTCRNLETIEFGNRLETIGRSAFSFCASLKCFKLPFIITIERHGFWGCQCLIDIELSERLETIGSKAFWGCKRLQRIAIPLKRDLFEFNDDNRKFDQFKQCFQLTTVELIGEAHTKTIASLHMESWRTEMTAEINRINGRTCQ